MENFKVIGFQKVFDNETAYAEIPKFWDEICEKYAASVYAGDAPANRYETFFDGGFFPCGAAKGKPADREMHGDADCRARQRRGGAGTAAR